MSTNPLSELEFTRRTAKRAQYEAFEYTLISTGVLVRNGSHAHPDEHEYVVTVENGIPTTCECPADEHHEGACKHRVAVAIRRPIIQAATEQQLIADGGTPAGMPDTEDGSRLKNESREAVSVSHEDCDCINPGRSFPCWECVRTGRRSLEECDE